MWFIKIFSKVSGLCYELLCQVYSSCCLNPPDIAKQPCYVVLSVAVTLFVKSKVSKISSNERGKKISIFSPGDYWSHNWFLHQCWDKVQLFSLFKTTYLRIYNLTTTTYHALVKIYILWLKDLIYFFSK